MKRPQNWLPDTDGYVDVMSVRSFGGEQLFFARNHQGLHVPISVMRQQDRERALAAHRDSTYGQ